MDFKNKKYTVRLTMWFLVMATLFVSVLFLYQRKLTADLNTTTQKTLTEVAGQQTDSLRVKIYSEFEIIKSMAGTASLIDKSNQQLMINLLRIGSDETSFARFCFADTSGIAIVGDGSTHDDSSHDFFSRAMAGETVFSEPYWSEYFKDMIVTIATPVYHEKKVAGVLSGSYLANELDRLFASSSFGGMGYAYIVNSEGYMIAKTKNSFSLSSTDNFFNALMDCTFDEENGLEIIKENMKNKVTGVAKYRLNNQVRLTSYQPLGINDWYVFSIAPMDVVGEQVNQILFSTYLLAGFIVLIFVLLLLYIAFSQRRHVRELSSLAFVDSLTGANNRKRFLLSATDMLQCDSRRFVFAILDIDKFKVLNDTLGYTLGDDLLKCIAKAIGDNIEGDELFGRCDSDEFYVLLEYKGDCDVEDRIFKIISIVEDKFKGRMDNSYNLVMCVGVCVIIDHTESVNVISDRAKHAKKLVKGGEKSAIAFYSEEIRNRIVEEKIVENKMHDALANEEFILYLQPKYLLDSETIYGAEALVRWKTDGITMRYPNEFIHVFEKNGFITRLDMYMLEKSCEFIRQWLDNGIEPIPISINFSRLHLKNRNFVDDIADIVKKYNIPPQVIEIELTESTMLNNEEVLIDVLSHLHEHGFTLSMDDFGSGYSSLGLLKNLPVDTVKLDRTFFTQYRDYARAKTVIASMISMAKKLGIYTVAEGVETQEHIDLLRELGCDIVQGYYYAKPMTAYEFNKLLTDERSAAHE